MALFIIAKYWKPPTWANIGEWLNYDTLTKWSTTYQIKRD